MSSSDKPATYQTNTVSNDPWGPQQAHLKSIFQRAGAQFTGQPTIDAAGYAEYLRDNPNQQLRDLYVNTARSGGSFEDVYRSRMGVEENAPHRFQSFGQEREFYPNSTVVPFADQTEQALQMQEQRAVSGSPTMQAAQTQAQQTLGGSYLDAGNPYMQKAMGAVISPMATQFSETVMPAISSQFSKAGRYGSGAQERVANRATDDFMRQVGDVTGAMAYKGYGDERARQMQAATLAPTYAQQDYQDINALKGVGAEREAQAGAELQEDINRFNFQQNLPYDELGRYLSLVGGGYGGSSQSVSPIYRNKTADYLGMAGTAAGIGTSLFGQGGIWPQ